jgi:uncharacterized protein (DUF2236 family)
VVVEVSARSCGGFRRYLDQLAAGVQPGCGFFSPGTVFWQVSREPALLLAGMRALLLQIAHPKIAQGVADHSRYREDLLGRGIRTFTAVYSIVFGEREQAIEAALRVRRVHDRVHGHVVDPLPRGMHRRYDANDPELLMWVAATLLDSSIMAFELFVRALRVEEKEQYYEDAKLFGQMFGVPPELYPVSWSAFQTWWAEMLDSDTLTVTDTARRVHAGLVNGSWPARILAPLNCSMAVMLLPERIAREFGLRRGLAARMTFSAMVGLTRGLTWPVPTRLRGVPAARHAERRRTA